ncbi:MAG: S6e family ribosomal protein [Nanoarchaeota archaeon]
MELKLVFGTKDGKSYQKEVKDVDVESLYNKCIGDTVSGDELGFPGYEFMITGGSDKCGFPMRKGIQSARKKIMVLKGVGCSGLDRNDKKQKGLLNKKTVCGERITKTIHQVNLKVMKEGSRPLVGETA